MLFTMFNLIYFYNRRCKRLIREDFCIPLFKKYVEYHMDTIIHFELRGGIILIHAEADGRQGYFAFDTGAMQKTNANGVIGFQLLS